jgi:hypothetical protein
MTATRPMGESPAASIEKTRQPDLFTTGAIVFLLRHVTGLLRAQCSFEVAHLRACRQRTCTRTDINRRRGQVWLCQTRADRLAARRESKVAAYRRRPFGTN